MFKWLCKHDFVSVDSKTVEHAVKEVVIEEKMDVDPRDIIYASPFSSGKILEDKVCIKCKMCLTNLSDFKNKVKNYTEVHLQKMADQLKRMQEDASKDAREGRHRTFLAREILKEHLDGK